MAEWFVYILRCADKTLYTGVATDLEARAQKHNAGKVAKYTRGRRPVKLVSHEKAVNCGATFKREHAIKRLRTLEKRRLVRTRTDKRELPDQERRKQGNLETSPNCVLPCVLSMLAANNF